MGMQILDDGSKAAGYVRGYAARQSEIDQLLALARELKGALRQQWECMHADYGPDCAGPHDNEATCVWPMPAVLAGGAG
jgi:hypothetical protein